MADREERKAEAAQHCALMKSAFGSETKATISAAIVYEDGEGRALSLPPAPRKKTETLVTSAFAPEALFRFACGKTAVADPASFTRPGGAYEDGAFGPEQILCANSNLYQVLIGIKSAYHDANRDYRCGQLFTDRAAYLPGVMFLKNGSVKQADVIAIAEPLRARALENHRSERECDNALERRIETLLNIAAANECETLIVGAFGCGRLGYQATQSIDAFRTWMDKNPGALGRIVFAVPHTCERAFDEAFGAPKESAPAQVTPAEDADEDEEWRNVELPEGVTLR